MRVLDLHILMPHERPRRQVALVELRRPPEVLYRPLWLLPQRIVVPDHTAHLGPVLVDAEEVVRELGELDLVLGDVEDVGEHVDVVDAQRVELEDRVELELGAVEVCDRDRDSDQRCRDEVGGSGRGAHRGDGRG